jgi:hypothetical protein
MVIFTRKDLIKTYTWSAGLGDNPKLKGEPDNSLLSRSQGYEVLYMIQKLMSKWSLKTITSGQKIERMIHEAPSILRSQVNVEKWIYDNWSRFS